MDSRRNEDVARRPSQDEGPAAWEARVAGLAKQLAYPPVPEQSAVSATARRDLTRRRPFVARPAFALALVVLATGIILLATPGARSAIVRVFPIGVARIFVTEPDSESAPLPSRTAPPDTGAQVPMTATPVATKTIALEGGATAAPEGERNLPSGLKDLPGRTTFAEAQQQAPFPIALPAHPPGLGEPDFVFVQEYVAPVLILAWSDPAAPEGVSLSLWMFPQGTLIDKIHPDTVVETTVDGLPAVWTQGRHMLYARNGDVELVRLVTGNTLIWERNDITFRLETFLPQDEAVKVAESVR